MKKFTFTISDLGIELTSTFSGNTLEEAEKNCRETYSIELDCFPEDVEIISVVEETE